MTLYEFDTEGDEYDLTQRKGKYSVHNVPFYWGILVAIWLGILFAVAYFLDGALPSSLTVNDEKNNYPDRFIAERAIHDLKVLTDMGPRVAGSYENEILATDYLDREIGYIIQGAHKSQKIELDHQVASGAYVLNRGEGNDVEVINSYANVQNVIVKLYGKNETGESILVNSHFDSVPTSPGGSDDGINVVAMLEILRKLSKSSSRLEHNIIFLFNGAEETVLQASHAFITQHKWASECKILINLEACGAGGKIILFQSGPGNAWLMKHFVGVPRPYGQAAGEEIFQSGIIPSDTDFRIFRDFGNLVGVDFAFFKQGYRYHTKYDDFKNIPEGSYQHVGDNILHLIKSLGNTEEFPERTPDKAVYYDVFSYFMITYSTSTAFILNLVVAGVSFLVFFYSWYSLRLGISLYTLRYFLLTLGAILLGWILSGLAVFVIALILDSSGFAMSWYGHPWLILGIFVTPTIGIMGSILPFVNHKRVSLNIRAQIQAHTVRIIWTVVLLVATLFEIRTAYALMIPVFFNTCGFILIHLFRLERSVRNWQYVYLVSLVIPTLLLIYQALTTLQLFVPITGRMGSNRNADVLIGLISFLFTVLITSPYVILTNTLRDLKFHFGILAGIFTCCFILAFTPVCFPYSGDWYYPSPQRHWIMHTRRVFYNESGDIEKTDSGIFLLNLDRNSPKFVEPYIADLSKAKSLEGDCEKYLLCGLPLSHAKMKTIMKYSTWVPSVQPVIHEPLTFVVNSKENIASRIIRYNVTIGGPDRVAVYIRAKNNNRLTKTSMVEKISIQRQEEMLEENKIYFIIHTSAKEIGELNFTFDIEVPSDFNDTTTVDIAISGIYVHEKKMVKTPYYVKFISEFPPWADVTAYLGSYMLHVI